MHVLYENMRSVIMHFYYHGVGCRMRAGPGNKRNVGSGEIHGTVYGNRVSFFVRKNQMKNEKDKIAAVPIDVRHNVRYNERDI